MLLDRGFGFGHSSS